MPALPPSRASLSARLSLLAASSPSLLDFRRSALALLREVTPFDAAVFHALSPRVPLSTGVFLGITAEELARSLANWDDLAVELGTLRELASRHWAATDEEAFPQGSRARSRFERHVTRPFKMRSLCMVHLMVRGSLRAAVVLMSRRRAAFDAGALATLRSVAPSIALADTLHATLDQAEQREIPLTLVCRDQRLTPRQREVAELLALGHTNQTIATALGLSANTTRNHLAKMFARLGAANRTEFVRLVALSPA